MGNYCYLAKTIQTYNSTWSVGQSQCQVFQGNLLQFTSDAAYNQFIIDGPNFMFPGESAFIGNACKNLKF